MAKHTAGLNPKPLPAKTENERRGDFREELKEAKYKY